MRLDCHLVAPLMVGVACAATGPAAQAGTSINYGPISHSGLKDEGAAARGLKLALQFGLIVNQSGLQSTVKNASNPGSSSHGKYLSLSSLQKNFGASSSKSNAVRATAGILPNQILTTYGVDQLQ